MVANLSLYNFECIDQKDHDYCISFLVTYDNCNSTRFGEFALCNFTLLRNVFYACTSNSLASLMCGVS